MAVGVTGDLAETWQEVAAGCCVVINGELLFFHLGMITQGSCPDSVDPEWDTLIDEDTL